MSRRFGRMVLESAAASEARRRFWITAEVRFTQESAIAAVLCRRRADLTGTEPEVTGAAAELSS